MASSSFITRRTAALLAIAAGISAAVAARGSTDKEGSGLKRVTGIGGVFFKARNPVALRAWYKQHLGIDVQPWGGAAFRWTDDATPPASGTTAWSVFPADGDDFAPSESAFMINYRVADLHALLAALRAEGCTVLDKTTEDANYGKFGWVMDIEGNKIELWQPPPGK